MSINPNDEYRIGGSTCHPPPVRSEIKMFVFSDVSTIIHRDTNGFFSVSDVVSIVPEKIKGDIRRNLICVCKACFV